jgi:hypothetical protein
MKRFILLFTIIACLMPTLGFTSSTGCYLPCEGYYGKIRITECIECLSNITRDQEHKIEMLKTELERLKNQLDFEIQIIKMEINQKADK